MPLVRVIIFLMSDIVKLSLTFLLIVLLLRRKLGIGWVLLTGAGGIALLYMMPPMLVIGIAGRTLIDKVTIKLALALSFIRIFEMVLRERNVLAEMMEAAKGILRSRRAVIVSMPLLIGMLPSIGGAYFSAPMVEESTKGLKMSGEEKSFINYWYRHPWEFILPLYPGVLLASAVTGIEMWTLILANLACAVAIGITGFLFSLRGGAVTHPVGASLATREGGPTAPPITPFLPILAVLALVVVLRVELHLALILAVAGLFVFYRFGANDVFRSLRHGFSLDVMTLIIGVLLFKNMMEGAGAVKSLSASFTLWGIPLLPMLFLLPFVTGVLTGITIGFIGATFPLLMSLPGGGEVHAVSFAFAAGFLGVLLSPVHVCLLLTREYFKADMAGIYRRMMPAAAMVFAVALAEYFIVARFLPR